MSKDSELVSRIAESNIRQEMNLQQLKEITQKISESHDGIKDAVETFNDHFIFHSENVTNELKNIKFGCQKVNDTDKNRLWKIITVLLAVVIIILFLSLGQEKLLRLFAGLM